MALHDDLQVLGLSNKEKKALLALRDGADTPLKIARETGVSRSAVYATLQNFRKRGLAASHITNGRKHWRLNDEQDIDRSVYDLKRSLLKIPEGSEVIHGRSDSIVTIHRGAEAIKKLMLNLFAEHKYERFYSFQGGNSTAGWNAMFSPTETNKVNRDIKKNRIIAETVSSEGWFEEQTRLLGVDWARDFEGRTARVNVLDKKYFQHGGQVWVFKDSLYLMALKEELILEIQNSGIQRMILKMFEFMQENSRAIDVNELLRDLIAENTKN